MSEEAEATAPPGSGESGPVTEAEAKVSAPSPEAPEQDASGEGAEAQAEGTTEVVEFDFGGNKKSWPKGTPIGEIAAEIEAFTKGTWSDYTRKSQEVAAQKQAVEAEKAAVQALSKLSEEGLAVYSEGLQLSREIEQLRKVDLPALWQSNPDQARQVSDLISLKQAQYDRTLERATEIGSRRVQQEQEQTARQLDEGRRAVEKMVKGFKEDEVIDYAVKTYGMSLDAAKSWPLNPAGAAMAYKAMLWDRMQAKAVPTAKPAAPPATPVTAIKGRSAPVAKDPNNMTDAEWVQWRNSQLAKRKA